MGTSIVKFGDMEDRIKNLLVEEYCMEPFFLVGYCNREEIIIQHNRDDYDATLMNGALGKYGFELTEDEEEEQYD